MAILDYEKTISLNPNYPKAHVRRGIAYLKMDRYDNGMKDFTEAIKLDPDCAETYYNRGKAYLSMIVYSKAMKDFNKAIELEPGYADLIGDLLSAHAKGDSENAMLPPTDKISNSVNTEDFVQRMNEVAELVRLRIITKNGKNLINPPTILWSWYWFTEDYWEVDAAFQLLPGCSFFDEILPEPISSDQGKIIKVRYKVLGKDFEFAGLERDPKISNNPFED